MAKTTKAQQDVETQGVTTSKDRGRVRLGVMNRAFVDDQAAKTSSSPEVVWL
jgi:hypothetical protein